MQSASVPKWRKNPERRKADASFVVNPLLYVKVQYDPVKDFAPVSLVAVVQSVLVANPKLPATSVKELIALPEVPTAAEAGVKGFDAATWYALLAPVRTPREIVSGVNGEVVRILKQPEFHARLSAMGVESVGSSPEQLAQHIRSELPKWARVVRQSGARVD